MSFDAVASVAPAARLSRPVKSPSCRSNSTPYLFTHYDTPAFRIRIPLDLQPCLRKTEYRRSLGRCYAAEAKLRALRLATAALEVFSFARSVIQARREIGESQGESGSTQGPIIKAGSTPRRVNWEKHQVQQDNSQPSNRSTSSAASTLDNLLMRLWSPLVCLCVWADHCSLLGYDHNTIPPSPSPISSA